MGEVTQTTTNNYASALKLEVPSQMHSINIHIIEKNVNAIHYKILGSNNDVNYETLKAETDVAKNASAYEVVEDVWRFIDVQIQAGVGGAQGSVNIIAVGD